MLTWNAQLLDLWLGTVYQQPHAFKLPGTATLRNNWSKLICLIRPVARRGQGGLSPPCVAWALPPPVRRPCSEYTYTVKLVYYGPCVIRKLVLLRTPFMVPAFFPSIACWIISIIRTLSNAYYEQHFRPQVHIIIVYSKSGPKICMQ